MLSRCKKKIFQTQIFAREENTENFKVDDSFSLEIFFFYIEKIIAQNFKIYLPVEIKRIIKYLHEMKGEALEKSMQKKKPVSLELCALSLSRNMQEREKKRRQN